jgi:hypothetical protein
MTRRFVLERVTESNPHYQLGKRGRLEGHGLLLSAEEDRA